MGRGPDSRAVTARGLLFGPRSRGQGPLSKQPQFKFSRDKQATTLAELCGDQGIVADEAVVAARLRQSNFLVVDFSGQGHGTISLTSDERWLDGVGLHYRPEPYGGPESNVFAGGEATITGLADLEQTLRQPLEDAGFDYIEFEISGQDAIDRFERGENIDIAAMDWHATDPSSRSWSITKRLNDFRQGQLDNGFTSSLDAQDIDQLDQIIEQLLDKVNSNQDGSLLRELVEDELGRAVLCQMPPRIPVRLTLSDRGKLSAGLPR